MTTSLRTINAAVVILAAGKGTRLNATDTPKAMFELRGKPMVSYVVDTVKHAGFSNDRICLVVGFHKEKVMDYFGKMVTYATQQEQLGTGHAVAATEAILKGTVEDIVVLYGDMPFVTTGSVERLIARHRERNNTVTLMTVTVPNFEDQYAPLYSFSRVIRRAADGHIDHLVEMKDATPEELKITELNPCYFCFKADWLWENLKKLDNHNVQKEYYLVDVVKMAIEQDEKISSIEVSPQEAIGINTPDDLSLAKELLNK